MTRIGVLALQGDSREHIEVLRRLGVEAVEVRLPWELEGLDGLIMPGGESTTLLRLMLDYELAGPLREMALEGFPMWGTCAGMIVMAQRASDLSLPTLGVMNIGVRRNAFGRQVDSFEADLAIAALGPEPFRGIFIRAPQIEEVGARVEVLAQRDSSPIAVRQGKLLATIFHPELTQDLRLHRYFLETIVGAQPSAAGSEAGHA